MASEVFTGTSNFTYTNTKTENVRVVINYMESLRVGSADLDSTFTLALSWANVTVSHTPTVTTGLATIQFGAGKTVIGKSLAGYIRQTGTASGATAADSNFSNALASFNMVDFSKRFVQQFNIALPTEIFLRPSDRLQCTCGIYNVIVITESGS